MKIKNTSKGLAILIVFVFVSCKKDYSCKCSDVSEPDYIFTIHDTKENAKQKCESKIYFTGGCGIE